MGWYSYTPVKVGDLSYKRKMFSEVMHSEAVFPIIINVIGGEMFLLQLFLEGVM